MEMRKGIWNKNEGNRMAAFATGVPGGIKMFEYKGYTVIQVNKEHACVIKDGKRVLHAQCRGELSEEDMKELVDSFLTITKE